MHDLSRSHQSCFVVIGQTDKAALVGDDLAMDLAHEAAAALEVAAELVDELIEAHAPLRASRRLMCLWNRRRHRQRVADE